MTWHQVVARFAVHSITAREVSEMTLMQMYSALDEFGEDIKFRVRLAGGEVPDEDKVATLQDLLALGS